MFKAFAALAVIGLSVTAHAFPSSSDALIKSVQTNPVYLEKLQELQPIKVTISRVSPTDVSADILEECTGGSRSGSIILIEMHTYSGAVQALYYGTPESAAKLRVCGVR